MSASYESLVAAQFGPRAQAYVSSTDHARGADLDRLAAIVSDRPAGRVLDLGCGGGHVSFTLAPFADEITAYDLSPDMLAAVRQVAVARGLSNIVTEQGTAEALPFADASFDVVASRYSAHHWRDLAAGLAGIARVTRPDGLVVMMDVVSPGEALLDTFLHGIELLRDPTHIRNYTVAEWADGLRAAGLVPGAPTRAKLRLDFAAWIARSGTPELQARAIRAMQTNMPPHVIEHFAVEPDGSFTVDTMMVEATHP